MKKGLLKFGILLTFVLLAAYLFIPTLSENKNIPIYTVNNGKLMKVDFFHTNPHYIGDFNFENQNGEWISQAQYEDKIYVADFFFTTCPNICVPMATNMKKIQDEFKNDPEVMLLSHTVNPEKDSVQVLKKYAIEKGADDKKWNLVTGDKLKINAMAVQQYYADEETEDLNDFVHTENFILVDKRKRIRGRYNGTDSLSIRQLILDIHQLKLEEKD